VVTDFQTRNPNLPGVDLEHLRGAVRPLLDAKVFRLLVDRLLASGVLVRRGNVVHTSGHAASLAGIDDALAARMLARVTGAGAMPPTLKELALELGVDAGRVLKVAGVLVLRGDLVKVSPDLFFAQGVIDDIRARLADRLRGEGEITAAGFRDLIGASRKYCIPLLDWFDRAGLTIRVGDVRRLRRT
jgi:selenocysteine-specific elongation factor